MVTLRPTAQATLVLIMMQALRPFTSLNHLLLKEIPMKLEEIASKF
jgi:hypothetical protein